MSENARYWIWLQNALGYGAKIKIIIDEYKSAKLLYELGESEWKMSTVLSKRQVEKLIMTDVGKSDEIIDCCSKNGYKIIDFDDKAYPKRLKEIINPPAVLGNGLGNNYLKANEGLRNMIKQNGALVTEYQPNVPANRTSFPMRNRIISGLSLGILVVEAGVKSGSLITANLAIEQNRDVYAVPASIFSSDFSGTNKLISDGARLAINPVNVVEAYENDYPTLDLSKIRTANEIVLDNSEKTLDTSIVKKKSAKELNVKPTPENNLIDKKYSFENLEKGRENRRKIDENVWSLEGNNKIVYDCIGEEFTQVDDIIEKSGLTASQVLVSLTFLELKKVIISASGKRFKKS